MRRQAATTARSCPCREPRSEAVARRPLNGSWPESRSWPSPPGQDQLRTLRAATIQFTACGMADADTRRAAVPLTRNGSRVAALGRPASEAVWLAGDAGSAARSGAGAVSRRPPTSALDAAGQRAAAVGRRGRLALSPAGGAPIARPAPSAAVPFLRRGAPLCCTHVSCPPVAWSGGASGTERAPLVPIACHSRWEDTRAVGRARVSAGRATGRLAAQPTW